MLNYERDAIKRGFRAVKKSVAAAACFVAKQITDPAIRRGVILGGAAYGLRKMPFLDQPTAEALSDKVLVLAGVLLSAAKGSQELAEPKAAAEHEAGQVAEAAPVQA